MPESFWGDFAQVLGDVAAHGQYAAIDEQVDAMLRIYLARNGEYRVEPLLEAGYHAHGDSMEWLLGITAAATIQRQCARARDSSESRLDSRRAS